MLEKMPAAVGKALRGVRPGFEKIASSSVKLEAPDTLKVASDAFLEGGQIPARFTDDGAKTSPPLSIGSAPPETKSLILIVEDADSPTPAPLVHALVWDIPPDTLRLDEGALDSKATPAMRRDAVLGKNSFLTLGWLPPDPPPAHGPHRYAFQVFALDKHLNLAEGTGRSAVLDGAEGHVLAKGRLIGIYER